jgi:hypothetical protein
LDPGFNAKLTNDFGIPLCNVTQGSNTDTSKCIMRAKLKKGRYFRTPYEFH